MGMGSGDGMSRSPRDAREPKETLNLGNPEGIVACSEECDIVDPWLDELPLVHHRPQ